MLMTIHTIRELSPEEFSTLRFEAIAALTGAERFIKSRPWNPHLVVSSTEFENSLASTASVIDKAEGRRRRSTEVHAVFLAALRALILDLFSAWTADPELQVGIHLDAKPYGATHTGTDTAIGSSPIVSSRPLSMGLSSSSFFGSLSEAGMTGRVVERAPRLLRRRR
jgi:hypothetical protein